MLGLVIVAWVMVTEAPAVVHGHPAYAVMVLLTVLHHCDDPLRVLRPKTGQHDIDFKVKQARMFLESKDKVQVSVVFRGREIVHIQEGHRVMETVIDQLPEICKVEVSPSQQGRRIVATLAPK